MKRREAAFEAKKRVVIVRKLRRVVIDRKALLPLVQVSEDTSLVKRVVICRKPVEVQPVPRKEMPVPVTAPSGPSGPIRLPKELPVAPAIEVVNKPSLSAEAASARKQPDRWSECGQIYFTGGKAYGISPGLRTIFVGEQPFVESFLRDGVLSKGLSEMQREALRRIKEGKVLQAVGSRS